MSPGEYRLLAREALGDSEQTAVRILAEEETLLRDFLELERAHSVHLTIDPPAHPELGAWSVALTRLDPFSSFMKYDVDGSGQVVLDGIGRGLYDIAVLADGQQYFLDRLVVEEPPGPLTIQIALVAVLGQLRLGDRGLAATLVFGGRRGSRSVSLESDEEGRFSGPLPGASPWRVSIDAPERFLKRTLARVAVEPDSSGTARLDIRLEDFRLSGRVVDRRGDPKAAQVDFFPQASGADLPTSLRTDETGRFTLRGLPRGVVALEAHTADQQQSETVSVAVDGGEADVTLVVAPRREVHGRVLSAATLQPVAGAVVYVIPEGQPGIHVSPVRSGPDGRFRSRLPAGTVSATVACSAEAHATTVSRLHVDRGVEARLLVRGDGGELSLEWPAREPGDPVPLLVHQETGIEPALLARLGRRPGEATGDASDRMTVPNLAPGRYALCLVPPAAYRAGRRTLSNTSECVSGTLTPGGQLFLARAKAGTASPRETAPTRNPKNR